MKGLTRKQKKRENKRRKFVQYMSAGSYKPTKNHYAEEVLLRRRYVRLVIITLVFVMISAWGIFRELITRLSR